MSDTVVLTSSLKYRSANSSGALQKALPSFLKASCDDLKVDVSLVLVTASLELIEPLFFLSKHSQPFLRRRFPQDR